MPDSTQTGTTSSDNLQGWKEVASYLARSVRCVQRWEREIGLPVHRIKGVDGQSVYAVRSEIDAWRASRDLPKPEPEDIDTETASVQSPTSSTVGPANPPAAESGPQIRRSLLAWIAAAAMIVAAASFLAGRWSAASSGPVAEVRASGTTIVAFDALGRVRWRHDLGTEIALSANASQSGIWNAAAFADLDGDQVAEILVPVHRLARSSESDSLLAFDQNGTLKWSYVPDFSLNCGPERFTGPWSMWAITVDRSSSPAKLLLGVNHRVRWPGFVVEVSGSGTGVIRFVQSGWVMGLAMWQNAAARLIAVTGVANEFNRPSLTLLDAQVGEAASPSDSPAFGCLGSLNRGRPRKVFILPNLETRGLRPYSLATQPRITGDSLSLTIGNDFGDSVLEVTSQLEIASLTMGDAFVSAHYELEQQHTLKHRAEDCPDILRPHGAITWTPQEGWQRIEIPPRQKVGG